MDIVTKHEVPERVHDVQRVCAVLFREGCHQIRRRCIRHFYQPQAGMHGFKVLPIAAFAGGDEEAVKAIFCLRNQIESDNEYIRENIISWNIVSNDYLTEFEQSQLDYEGQIRFPAKELVW